MLLISLQSQIQETVSVTWLLLLTVQQRDPPHGTWWANVWKEKPAWNPASHSQSHCDPVPTGPKTVYVALPIPCPIKPLFPSLALVTVVATRPSHRWFSPVLCFPQLVVFYLNSCRSESAYRQPSLRAVLLLSPVLCPLLKSMAAQVCPWLLCTDFLLCISMNRDLFCLSQGQDTTQYMEWPYKY